jgi:hypothetical protein
MRGLRSKLSFANACSFLALVIALGTGGAYAANTIGSSDIIDESIRSVDLNNGEVKVADIGQGAVATDELANGQVRNPDIGGGEVRSGNVANDNLTGGDIAANSLKGVDIDEATLDIGDAARAYASVNPGSCTGTPGTCQAAKSKGISSVTRPGTGVYCVTAPGINASVTPAAVTVDWRTTEDPEGNASAMTVGSSDCPLAAVFNVRTERQSVIDVDSGGVQDNAHVSGPAEPDDTVGFTIVIP